MKNLVTMFLVTVMLTSLIGCTSEEAKEDTTENEVVESPVTNEADASSTEDEEIIVGYIAKNTVDAFHSTLNKAAQEKLDDLKAKGEIKDWRLLDGNTDPVTQVNLLQDAINIGCNAIIILPAESAGSDPVIKECAEKNIPVFVVNSKTDSTDELATAFIGSDDVQAGKMMAVFVQGEIPEGGGYGHIQGVIGNSAQIQRGEGIHEILDADPNWTILEEQTGEWQAEKAIKFAEDWLTKYGEDLNAIICDNDDMSSAVQAAMNAAGREDIVCIGVDGNAGPMQMVKDGELRATVYQDGAGQVTTAIDLMMAYFEGKKIDKINMVPFVLITKDNVEQYMN